MESFYYTVNPWWQDKSISAGIIRKLYLDRLKVFLNRPQIEVLIGSRRIGKTTLLKQFIKSLCEDKKVNKKEIFYLALDHPSVSKISVSEHLKNFRRMFMHNRDAKLYLFLDEVQESPQWESELKSIYDVEQVKIFCTGSTSSLIKSQGGKLTGRQIVTTVYPLSFSEMALFRGEQPDPSEDYKYERLAEEYLNVGGYPENVLAPSAEYMNNLVDDILAKDLFRIFPVKKPFILKDLIRLVASSVGSRTSYNKLSKVLGISVDTVREYLSYLESAFLISPMGKWTTSYSEKIYSQKKIYLWDNNVKTLFTGAGDQGARAENAVFIELKRRGIDCGYYAESEREVDFITGNFRKFFPVEVKYIDSFDWKDKRFAGIKLFLNRFPQTKSVLAVTKSVDKKLDIDNVNINLIPLWKFLIRSENYI